MDWLLDPLSYDFMRDALMAGILIGILCPVVGTYLIVQRMALLGDVVAHALLPGLAIAHFLGIPLLLGAFGFGMLGTFMTSWIRSQSRIQVDTAMAITFSSFFALGITLLSVLQSQLALDALLFGDILSTTLADVGQIGLITLAVLAAVRLFYKELLFFTFDVLGAEAVGLPVGVINLGLMAAITLTIIAGMKTVGVILVIALMVTPAATAYLLVKELHWMMVLGAGLGALGSLTGIYISYYANLPSGPAIALTVFSLFLLTLLFSPSQGILTRLYLGWRQG
ncbi:metal ABC transporter permease [Almyronema epifaneia]|uniref:Metal ABC transporter permease n=1 Tax=Almyronema epifaneia S1 TaxID=2991925 RepID=A0ABW6IFI4_9CYAN